MGSAEAGRRLDLRTQASQLKGGKCGQLELIPGKPEESLIIKRISAGEMPPPKLLFEAFVRPPSSDEVETLKAWIAGGAPPAPVLPAIVEKMGRRNGGGGRFSHRSGRKFRKPWAKSDRRVAGAAEIEGLRLSPATKAWRSCGAPILT